MLSISTYPPRQTGHLRLDFIVNGELVGEVELSLSHENIGIWGMQIFPDYRGKLLGNRLVGEIVEIVHKWFWNFSRIYLYVFQSNEKAIKAYKLAGLVEDKLNTDYKSNGVILMEMMI